METDVARATRMQAGTKFPSAANRDIPLNCYTQADLDVYTRNNNYKETPNPQWLLPGEAIQGCVPTTLIPEHVQDRRAYVDEQRLWFDRQRYQSYCDIHNKTVAGKSTRYQTPSALQRPLIPAGLAWQDLREQQATPARRQQSRQDLLADLASVDVDPLQVPPATSANVVTTTAASVAPPVPLPPQLDVFSQPPQLSLAGATSSSAFAPPVSLPPISSLLQATFAPSIVTFSSSVPSVSVPVATAASASTSTISTAAQTVTAKKAEATTQTKPRKTDSEQSDRLKPMSTYTRQGFHVGQWTGNEDQQTNDTSPRWSSEHDLTSELRVLAVHGQRLNFVTRTFDGTRNVQTAQVPTDLNLVKLFEQQMHETSECPWQLSVRLPPRLGAQNFDESLLPVRTPVVLTDQEGYFPQERDAVLITQHEARENLTAAQMAANATSLQWTVLRRLCDCLLNCDDMEERRSEITAYATFLLMLQRDRGVLAASQLTLATLWLRRDLMVHNGISPVTERAVFENPSATLSPMPTTRTVTLEPRVLSQRIDAQTTEEVQRQHDDFVMRNATELSRRGRALQVDYAAECQERQRARDDFTLENDNQLCGRGGRSRQPLEGSDRIPSSVVVPVASSQQERRLRQELATALQPTASLPASSSSVATVATPPSPAPAAPSAPALQPVSTHVNGYIRPEFMPFLLRQMGRMFTSRPTALARQAISVMREMNILMPIVNTMRWQNDLENVKRRIAKIQKATRPLLLDDEQRRAFDMITPALQYVLDHVRAPEATQQIETLLRFQVLPLTTLGMQVRQDQIRANTAAAQRALHSVSTSASGAPPTTLATVSSAPAVTVATPATPLPVTSATATPVTTAAVAPSATQQPTATRSVTPTLQTAPPAVSRLSMSAADIEVASLTQNPTVKPSHRVKITTTGARKRLHRSSSDPQLSEVSLQTPAVSAAPSSSASTPASPAVSSDEPPAKKARMEQASTSSTPATSSSTPAITMINPHFSAAPVFVSPQLRPARTGVSAPARSATPPQPSVTRAPTSKSMTWPLTGF